MTARTRKTSAASGPRAKSARGSKKSRSRRSERQQSSSRSRSQEQPPNVNPTLASPFTPSEQSFFESPGPGNERQALLPEFVDEVEPVLLRPEQLVRRLWFRRQVSRLMAGLGTFTLVAAAIRIASGL